MDKSINELPNVITVEALGVTLETGKKFFDTYVDKFGELDTSKQYIATSDNDSSKGLVNRLNALKFLENIVLDYAKFKPVNLYEVFKIPFKEARNEIEIALNGKLAEEEK